MNKAEKKLDALFWFIMMILPIVTYFISNYRQSSPVSFITYVNTNYAFTWLKTQLDTILTSAFGSTFAITGVLSYSAMVIFMHTLFDVFVWIPRFGHKLMEEKCK